MVGSISIKYLKALSIYENISPNSKPHWNKTLPRTACTIYHGIATEYTCATDLTIKIITPKSCIDDNMIFTTAGY